MKRGGRFQAKAIRLTSPDGLSITETRKGGGRGKPKSLGGRRWARRLKGGEGRKRKERSKHALDRYPEEIRREQREAMTGPPKDAR